ncbi:MAG: DUF2911 domain-containing protein [Gemmatimonadaceae bacterium]
MRLTVRSLALLPLAAPAVVAAQSASLTYRLGKDTLAIEQYTRTATSLTGEMVQRSGPAVARVTYTVTLGKDARATAVRLTRVQADGTPAPGAPREYRFTLGADSAVREVVFADSTQRRAFPLARAAVNFPTFVYGPTELLATLRKGGASDSIPALGLAGGVGFSGLTPLGGDSLRLRGSGYAMVLRFDANHRLQSVDGRGTTNKVVAERGNGGLDLAAIATRMKPTGTLSAREDARAGFGAGGIVVVDYGRPQVRERSVWGGTLVPFDSVWRAGANDATHLFTTRTLTFGTVTLAPGMYTLWVQHTRQGTFLIVNKQTGQWGTQYDGAQDVGRIEMQSAAAPSHVEELTYTVRALAPNRGVLELAWGDRVLSAPFGVTAGR